jgi:hypothetical protein
VPHRPRFDPKRPLVAAREFTFNGKDYETGDPFGPFDEGEVSDRLRARQYESRAVNFAEGEAAAEPPAEQVTMTGPAGGRYTITAPWLAEPEVVRGKVNAEKRLAELREEGAPLGFIEGGSAVTVEGGEGGWYAVDAPWLDEPEKVQGREAAESRQQQLHTEGEPASYKGYTLTPGENGWYAITKDGVEAEQPVALNVRGEDEARAAVATLRAGELIEGAALPAEWNLQPPEGGEGGEGGSADSGADTGEQGGENAANADPAATGEQQPEPGVDAPGNEAPEDSTVDTDKKDPNERAEELGNQPNAAEDAADEQRAGTEGSGDTPAGSGGEAHAVESDGEDGGDGTTGTVGP